MKHTTIQETIHILGNTRRNTSKGSLMSNGKDMLVGITKARSLQKQGNFSCNTHTEAKRAYGQPPSKSSSQEVRTLYSFLGVDYAQ